ncbi:hypothetical protein [Rhodococcus tukisamuensis]|uniref:Uncharacterized protein n=1 Tax=Rhodococcus tukisamuensis TaxID=168276 RepID=A0A1G6T9Z7_9NOCA|nr:hypothetical protein [Rhodococcus tukisamuensis]SDD25898.1 hypothetical protein SAMN05444580_103450 [Rhodococcus tukisamuensis]
MAGVIAVIIGFFAILSLAVALMERLDRRDDWDPNELDPDPPVSIDD